LLSILKSHEVSILHSHCFDPTLIGLIASRLSGVRFVFTRHHSDHHIRLKKRWHTMIDAYCARHSDRVIAVSEATRDIVVRIEGVPRDKVIVVHNGIEPMEVPPGRNIQKVKRELKLEGFPVCLVLARLHEEKGHEDLFRALPDIKSRVGRIKVLLAGEGPYEKRLMQEVKARGIEESVVFLGKRQDIPELISVSSVVVLPSLAESFGFASLEAMSLGKPVVATRVGGTCEVVSDGTTGLLVPPNDSTELASAICKVLEDPAWATRASEHGPRRARRFSIENMIDGYQAVYSEILQKRTSRKEVNNESSA
jgi:glycosyltransferase involved in cell wall biosynthesis